MSEVSLSSSELVEQLGRPIRLGMVGGGADSVIGSTHRAAFRVDGLYRLVAGALSIDPQIALASGRQDMIEDDRIYLDWRQMLESEAGREDRVEAVVVATPPNSHGEIAEAFLAEGIHVVCEKPLTATAAEAEKLAQRVGESGAMLLLTHCYTGYPMVREARSVVESGRLGELKLVDAEFASGERGVAVEGPDPERRHWRFRRDVMGPAVVLGEVGSHVHNLAAFVTGREVTSVSASLQTIARRREVYDNGHLNVRFEDGAQGRLWSSFVAAGNQHGLAIRVFGEEAGLSWRQEEPETLWLRTIDGETTVLTRGQVGLSDRSERATRFRLGHPEGYLLAFANLYRDFAGAIAATAAGQDPSPYLAELPNASDGVETLRLIEAAQLSHDRDGAWEALREP
jgi:predicted dehydrogenase